jgi:hypothetical protein
MNDKHDLILAGLYNLTFGSRASLISNLKVELRASVGTKVTDNDVRDYVRKLSQEAVLRIMEKHDRQPLYVELGSVSMPEGVDPARISGIRTPDKEIKQAAMSKIVVAFCQYLHAKDAALWDMVPLLIMWAGERHIAKQKLRRDRGLQWWKVGSNYVNTTQNKPSLVRLCSALARLYQLPITFISSQPE